MASSCLVDEVCTLRITEIGTLGNSLVVGGGQRAPDNPRRRAPDNNTTQGGNTLGSREQHANVYIKQAGKTSG